jgi:hypothetical protein
MNFELKKVTWNPENMPDAPQTLSLSFRKAVTPDETNNYTLVTDNLYVLPSGVVVNPPVIKGLENKADYVFRLTNAASGDTLDVAYSTPQEVTCSKFEKLYQPNSRIDYVQEDANFFEGMVPKGLAFYSLENDLSELIGNRKKVESQLDTITLKNVLGHTGTYNGPGYGGLLTDVHMDEILFANSAGAYGLGVYFWADTNDLPNTGRFPLMSCVDMNGHGVVLYIDNATRLVVWEQSNPYLKQTVTSTQPIVAGSWNIILVGIVTNPAGLPPLSYMYLNGANVGSGSITVDSLPEKSDAASWLYIGYCMDATGIYRGQGVFRNAFVSNSLSVLADNAKFHELASPVGYLGNRDVPMSAITIPQENLVKVSKNKVSFIIPMNTSYGLYQFYVTYNGRKTAPIPINVVPHYNAGNDFEYNFNFDGADGPVNYFQTSFYTVGKGEGTADGGVSPKNVYFKDNLLVLEAHGDWYNGQVSGVDNDGKPKLHDNPLDVLYGETWKTRVGAAVASRYYHGFGSYVMEAKLPKQLGVQPFFGVYHHARPRFQDGFFEDCLSRGIHPQGGNSVNDEIYLVESNRIAMEFPAIPSLAQYYDFDGLLSAPILTPYAGMTVSIRSIDEVDNGIFQLTNPALPNDRASWTKISEDFQTASLPAKDHVILKSGRGEQGVGTGVMTNGLEEFLDMHVAIGNDVWDDEFHQFRMDWYANKVEYYIDGTLIQTSTYFLPDMVGRFVCGLKFPTRPSSQSPWLPDPAKSTFGSSNWEHQTMTVRSLSFTPFTDAVAGGTIRGVIGETDPSLGLYAFP